MVNFRFECALRPRSQKVIPSQISHSKTSVVLRTQKDWQTSSSATKKKFLYLSMLGRTLGTPWQLALWTGDKEGLLCDYSQLHVPADKLGSRPFFSARMQTDRATGDFSRELIWLIRDSNSPICNITSFINQTNAKDTLSQKISQWSPRSYFVSFPAP